MPSLKLILDITQYLLTTFLEAKPSAIFIVMEQIILVKMMIIHLTTCESKTNGALSLQYFLYSGLQFTQI